MPKLSWSSFKRFISQGYGFFEEDLSSPDRYILTAHPKSVEFSCVIFDSDTTDKNDYENNYQSLKSACLCDTFAGQDARLFSNEALADGVYEESSVQICHYAHKVFNIENTHATNSLNFKIWGSPDASDWELVMVETSLAALTKVSISNNDYWKYIKISAEGNGGVSTVNAYIQVGP